MVYEKSGVTADYKEKCPPLLEQPENPKTETRNICKYLKGIYYYIFHSVMMSPNYLQRSCKTKTTNYSWNEWWISLWLSWTKGIFFVNISMMYTPIICAAMRLVFLRFHPSNKYPVQKLVQSQQWSTYWCRLFALICCEDITVILQQLIFKSFPSLNNIVVVF